MKHASYIRGMTLAETVVTVAILGIIAVAVTTFQRDVLLFNSYGRDKLAGIQDARSILRTMVREIRSTSVGNNGAYAITQAATSSITFFSDTDGDGLKEQIRYFLTGTILKKGIIKPTGTPLVYVAGNEVLSTLASNIRNATSSPLFEYFDSMYAGTSTPLSQPVTVTNVRLVKINLGIDVDPKRSPVPVTYTSQVSLRNLKDNL